VEPTLQKIHVLHELGLNPVIQESPSPFICNNPIKKSNSTFLAHANFVNNDLIKIYKTMNILSIMKFSNDLETLIAYN
jgi:hypothetical protein